MLIPEIPCSRAAQYLTTSVYGKILSPQVRNTITYRGSDLIPDFSLRYSGKNPDPVASPVALRKSTSTLALLMMVWATSDIALARSISIGLHSSWSASSVANKWLRRSSILFLGIDLIFYAVI